MRFLTWNWGPPKSNNRCPYKRKAEEDLSHSHRDEGHVKTEAETGVNASPTQGSPGATRSWKKQERILSRVFRETTGL